MLRSFDRRDTRLLKLLLILLVATLASTVQAACRDAVVLVHGNAGTPAHFDNTYVELRARGWTDFEILRPDWGSKTCAACNDHSGSEETPVLDALVEAIARSCTGRIDVIGHSMGVSLAAKQIVHYGLVNDVATFVGIAGAYRGLWSCGTYPWNVVTSTCGAQGLSVNSPLLASLAGKPLGMKTYSIKSWMDQIVCYGGVCTVAGVHSSTLPGETASHTLATGHFGLLTDTAVLQVNLIQ
jgi:triacylglycerol lipase